MSGTNKNSSLTKTNVNGININVLTSTKKFYCLETEALLNGAPDLSKITSFEFNKDTVNGFVGTQYFYPVDASWITADVLTAVVSDKSIPIDDRERVVELAIDFLNTKEGKYVPVWNERKPFFEFNEKIAFLYPVNHKRITLDAIDTMFKGKPSKALLRSILSELDLQGSSKSLLIDYIKRDRIDIFRVIGKSNTIQLSKEELREVISLPQFNRKSTSGLIGSAETADIVNRRSVLLHQDAADGEIFMELVNSITDEDTKSRFQKTLKRKVVLEKFKDYPEVMLWIKMQ
jgi:hypothetical protein